MRCRNRQLNHHRYVASQSIEAYCTVSEILAISALENKMTCNLSIALHSCQAHCIQGPIAFINNENHVTMYLEVALNLAVSNDHRFVYYSTVLP